MKTFCNVKKEWCDGSDGVMCHVNRKPLSELKECPLKPGQKVVGCKKNENQGKLF